MKKDYVGDQLLLHSRHHIFFKKKTKWALGTYDLKKLHLKLKNEPEHKIHTASVLRQPHLLRHKNQTSAYEKTPKFTLGKNK